LKRIPFLRRYPQYAGVILAFAAAWLIQNPSPGHAFPVTQIVQCALEVFLGAAATHKFIFEPTGLDHRFGAPKEGLH
jgi:hypothetical protein